MVIVLWRLVSHLLPVKPINTKTLVNVINRLPAPSRKGEVHQAYVQNRVAELNEDLPISIEDTPDREVSGIVIQFVAVKYVKDRNQWLEWEILSLG